MIDRVIDLSGKTENGNIVKDIITYTGFINNIGEALYEGDAIYIDKKIWIFYGIVEFSYEYGTYMMKFTKKINKKTGEEKNLSNLAKNNYILFVFVEKKNGLNFSINNYIHMFLKK